MADDRNHPIAWERRLARRAALLRGRLVQLRGAHTGRRFSVGRGTRIVHAAGLHASHDVAIDDYSLLDCFSTRGIRIGSHCSIDRNAWIHCGGTPETPGTGWVRIGDHSYIGCNAVLGAGGGIAIGRHVLIGQSVNLHAEDHVFGDHTRPIREQGVTARGIVIEDDVWIGAQVVVLDGVTIGRGAVIGAGAVVTRSVPPQVVVTGVPARMMRRRDEPPA